MNSSLRDRLVACAAALMFMTVNAGAATASRPGAAWTAQEKAGADFVRRYFAAREARDVAAIRAMFTPTAQVVHDDGTQTDVPALLVRIAKAPKPLAPPTRTLDNFEFVRSDPVLVVAFDNEVSARLPGKEARTFRYRESWFLQQTPAGLRAFWVNYVPYELKPDESQTRPAAPSGDRPALPPREERAVKFVEDFFKAYGAVDVAALRKMFLPGSKIVHMEGTETSVDDFINALREHPEPEHKYERPKPAPFDNFDFVHIGDVTLIAFDNHVSHWREGHPDVEHTFRENWLLKKTPDGMKALWASYSLYGGSTPGKAPADGRSVDPTVDLVITNADIMTVSHGTIENGSLWIRNGKIAGVGVAVAAPGDARIIDAGGRFVTPGIIDAHSHMGAIGIGAGGLDFDDGNERVGKPGDMGGMAGPNQADLRIRDSVRIDASTLHTLYSLLSSGLTAGLELPGSANLFGGQGAPMKLKLGRPRDEFFIKDAPVSMKIACTPFRTWKGRGAGLENEEDVAIARRRIYDEAQAYLARQEAYEKAAAAGRANGPPPPVDLKMEAIADILRGDTLLQMHCHGASHILQELAVARDYGITIRTVHHGTEAYQAARELKAAGTSVLGVADWWGGGSDVNDGIPWNIAILKQAGVRVALHGEAYSVARRLTQEAGKMFRYGEGAFTRDEALALVTLNPAWMMGLDDRMGSIDVGKDADIVIWEGDPLSSYGHAEKVFIEGELFFDATRPGLGLTQVEHSS